MLIFHISSQTPSSAEANPNYLTLLCNETFHLEAANSAYTYLNFEYQYRGLPLLLAMQRQGSRRLDGFILSNPEGAQATLKLKTRKQNYHQTEVRAVGSVCGSVVTIDSLGEMKILKVPE